MFKCCIKMGALTPPLLTMATTPHAHMWKYLHIFHVYILACIFAQGSYIGYGVHYTLCHTHFCTFSMFTYHLPSLLKVLIQDMVYITLSVTQIFVHFPCLHTTFHLCSRFLHRIWYTLHSLSHKFHRMLSTFLVISSSNTLAPRSHLFAKGRIC